MSEEQKSIEAFLAGSAFAVVGASANREKYGNKILRCYMQHDLQAIPVHPTLNEVEGEPCFEQLSDLCTMVHGVSIITPPAVTNQIIEEMIELGIKHVWMQPGAESKEAIARAQEAGINCIAGGPCLLVVLGYRDKWTPVRSS